MTPPRPWRSAVGDIYRALYPLSPVEVDRLRPWQIGELLVRPEQRDYEEVLENEARPQPTPEQMEERVARYHARRAERDDPS